jgi:hypothetical protein
MRKYSVETTRKEISCMRNKEGRLAGLVISGVGAAFQNMVMKER